MRWPSKIDRFWDNVIKSSGCWIWTGSHASGYGRLRWDGREMGAHRVSWLIHNGTIPPHLWVLHKCDNPSCVNPEHLWLGTHVDNMQDCVAKGRFKSNSTSKFGESNPSHKLSEKDVSNIKSLIAKGITHDAAAAQFHVSQSTVTRIVTGKRRIKG